MRPRGPPPCPPPEGEGKSESSAFPALEEEGKLDSAIRGDGSGCGKASAMTLCASGVALRGSALAWTRASDHQLSPSINPAAVRSLAAPSASWKRSALV